MSKHTKGPWKLTRKTKEGYQYIDGKYWWHLAQIVVEVGGELSAEGQANARLIATAPELLAELKKMVKAFDRNLPEGTVGRKWCDEAIAVITKAEGDESCR